MKHIAVVGVLTVVSTLAGATQAQNMDFPSRRSPSLPSGNDAMTDHGIIGFYPPAEVPPKTCVHNNVIHSAGARLCVGYDLATCTEAGTWDISEKGARDAPRCNR
jgi:hypothetical protein